MSVLPPSLLDCPFCSGRSVSVTNNLCDNYPELSGEWDKEKNGALSPKDVFYTSNKLVWWKCSQGHSWMDSVNHRAVRHKGCPVCTISPFISIAKRCPSLVEYWDYSRNLQASPESSSIGSRKTAYWICTSCSASFPSVISRMYSQFIMSAWMWCYWVLGGECLCPKCAMIQSTW